MIAAGEQPRKIWIQGNLNVASRNKPNCLVIWGWHVAPIICVRRFRFWFFWSQRMVIDPSLFTTPVTKATWKGAQNNPNATLTDTDWTYYRQSGETDPTFSKTNDRLAYYRLQLQLRSQSSVGPPPYANCP